MEHWHSLPREVMESSPLEMVKHCSDMVLSNLLWVALLEQNGVGPNDLPEVTFNLIHSVTL